jgi:hypothetical protein
MQITTKTSRTYWITPAAGVACGLIYLIAFSLGGQPGYGLIALGVMVAFSVAIALIGRRSETVRCSATATSGWPGPTCAPRP